MKHFFLHIVTILFCFTLICCAQKSNEVIITGQLEGVEEGTVIFLYKSEGNMLVSQQSDTIVNGTFNLSFTDSLDYPKPRMIMARGDGFPPTWLEIWVKPGAKVEIIGKDKLIRSWEVKSNVAEQQELNIYKKQIEQYERTTQSVMTEAYSYWDEIAKSTDQEVGGNLREKIDSLYAINDSMSNIIAETEVDIMDKNKTYSPVWMDKLDQYAKSLKYAKISDIHIGKIKSMYEGMSDELKKSEKGQSIQINLYPPTIVKDGDDMADADMWDMNGESRHFADYKGKYLLLDFWSAGCGPCIMAIPEMKEISEIYKDKLTVISISSDPKDIWEQTSKEKDITWVNLNDFKSGNGIWLQYGVTGIPHYVIISPEGKVITSWPGYGEGLLKKKMAEFIR
jgi:Thiol-disulfide isomerase and thioredoxins